MAAALLVLALAAPAQAAEQHAFAAAMNYATPVVNVGQGDTLTFTNLDQLARHDIVSEDGSFKSELLAAGQSGPVAGVEKLGQGSYGFHCSLHSWMKGVVNVGPAGTGVGVPSLGDVQKGGNPFSSTAPDPKDLNASAVPERIGPGEWPVYGHDLSNTRDGGPAGPKPGDLFNLGVAWTFYSSHGDFTGTPVVAGGVLAVGSNTGRVFAIDASTGKQIWHRDVGAPVNGTLAIDHGELIVPVAKPGAPFVAAFALDDGDRLWTTQISDQKDSDTYGSPTVWDGKVFIGTSAEYGETSDANVNARGTVVALDEKSGALLWRTFTVGEGHDGGSVWSTPAIDPQAKRLYVGTGNAYHEPADDNVDSVLVLDTGSGRILDAFHGYPGDVWNATSNMTAGPDYDFGASPQLIQAPDGRKLVGAGQKSAMYWALDATTLKPVWSTMTGPPTPGVGGIVGSTAYDGSRIYGPNTSDGETWALDRGGSLNWVSADAPAHFDATSVANGVVYANDLSGYLVARDAATGLVLGKFPLGNPSWGGVAVAGGSVFTSVGLGSGTGYIVSFRVNHPGAKPADDDGEGAPERVAEPKPCPRKKNAKAKKHRRARASHDGPGGGADEGDGSGRDPYTKPTPQQPKAKCTARKKHGKSKRSHKAGKRKAKNKKRKAAPPSNPPYEPKPDFEHHLAPGQDPHQHVHPPHDQEEGWEGGPSHPLIHRGDRFVTKPAGTKETLHLWYGPYTIGPGQDLNRVDIDVPLRHGFLVSLEPKLVKWPDMIQPSHQEAHIHHAHWFRPDPGNKEDNYFGGTHEWIFGNGDEETRGDFQPRTAAGGPNGPVYGQYFDEGPQTIIYMLHNKTAAPLVAFVVLDVTFIHGSAAENQAIFHRPFHDVAGILFGRTYNVPRQADGDGLYETTVDYKDAKDPRLHARGPIRWTSTVDGTIIGMGGHLHPGGIKVVVNNLGSKDHPCPDDGTSPYGGTQLYTSRARFRYTPWSEDFLMEVTDPGFRAPIHKGDVIQLTGVYENKFHAWYDVMTHNGIYVDRQQPPKPGCAPVLIDRPKANPRQGVLSKPWGPQMDHSCGVKWGWGDCDKPVKGAMKPVKAPGNVVNITNFSYQPGDFSSGIYGDTPWIREGEQLTFVNDDQPAAIRHSITTCPYPCNGEYFANYPTADGRWDSGTLGYDPIDGGSPNPVSKTPKDLPPGTYTYFCRIHPWMRGVFKVEK
ncbi:MAG: PQQ-binding-like beta-propeller repeat protein [Thermoleophilaceae bacterium]